MFDILAFAIQEKDEETVISLLKVIPLELLFDSDNCRDFFICMMERYQCSRSLDYLKSKIPDKINVSEGVELQLKKVTDDPADKDDVWRKIGELCQQKAPIELFQKCLDQYNVFLKPGKGAQAVHYLRASHLAYLLQDFSSALQWLKRSIMLLHGQRSKTFTPVTLVDAAISQVILALFNVLEVELPQNYLAIYKNNVCYMKQGFYNWHSIFLFNFDSKIKFETLQKANQALEDFMNFNRQLPMNQSDYKNNIEYQQAVKETQFTIKCIHQWFNKIEKKHGLSLLYDNAPDLQNILENMKISRLKVVSHFFSVKKRLLFILQEFSRKLGTPPVDDVTLEFRKTCEIEPVSRKVLDQKIENNIQTLIESKPKQVTVPKKQGNKKVKASNNQINHSAMEEQKEKTQSANPVNISSVTLYNITYFKNRPMAVSLACDELKPAAQDLPLKQQAIYEENQLSRNRFFPEEIYALFHAFNPRYLFMTGLAVCDFLSDRQEHAFQFAAILPENELFDFIEKNTALFPGCEIQYHHSGAHPTVKINYGEMSFSFYSVAAMPGESIIKTLTRDAHTRVFNVNAIYLWIDNNDIIRIIDPVYGARCFNNGIMHFSDSSFDRDFFNFHPEQYMRALYLVYRYELRLSVVLHDALIKAKPGISQLLYQVDETLLRSHYNLFIKNLGKTEAVKIFINHDVFQTLVNRGIFPLPPRVEANKNIASMAFKR